MLEKVVSFLAMIVAAIMGTLFFMKKKAVEDSLQENKEIASKETEIKNEAKNLEDTFLDDAITAKLKDQG
jgi:cell division protein FtsL